jgi:hypothetical protein
MVIGALAGLLVYFVVGGGSDTGSNLDTADKVASVIGALVGLMGLGLSAYGLFAAPSGGRYVSQRGKAAKGGRVVQVGGDRGAPTPTDRPSDSASARLRQRGIASEDGEVTQIGGDDDSSAQQP